ncbi:MAG: BP74-related protein [Pseudobdellovibrio sp.]
MLIFLSVSVVEAKIFHWPDYCESGNLKVTNTSASASSLWLQKFSPQLVNETEYPVEAKGSTLIRVEKTDPNDRFSLLQFDQQNTFKVSYVCGGDEIEATDLEGGVITYKKKSANDKLWLQNIFYTDNTIKIEFLNAFLMPVAQTELSLKTGTSTSLVPQSKSDYSYVRVSSREKFFSYYFNESKIEKPFSIKAVQAEVDTNAHYFLIAPSRSTINDSFVAKITDPDMVDKARQLIKNPSLEKMMFATIQKDSGGFNRNFNNAAKTHWSWSTKQVTNFADFGSVLCNGQPQAVEDRVESWVDDPGRICFWDYRVKRELTSEEVRSGQLSSAQFKTKPK